MDALEAAMLREPQVAIVPVHRFADGVYAREITIPAGTLVVGKIHKTRCLHIVSKGSILIGADGEADRLITAPCTFVAEPGARRVGLAVEETVWTTIHGTDTTDLAELELELIEPHDNPLLLSEALCRGLLQP